MLERRQRTGSGDIRQGREGGKNSDSHKISEAGCHNVSLSFGPHLSFTHSLTKHTCLTPFNDLQPRNKSSVLPKSLPVPDFWKQIQDSYFWVWFLPPSLLLRFFLMVLTGHVIEEALPFALNRNKTTLFFIQRRPMKAEGQDETGKCSSVHSNYLKSQRWLTMIFLMFLWIQVLHSIM